MTAAPILSVEAVDVRFGDTGPFAVHSVSLDIAQGESVGIVGESGSGKTTVLRAIMGLAPVTAGSIRLHDRPLTGPRPRDFYGRVQLIFQDPYASLHPLQTIEQILTDPLRHQGRRPSPGFVNETLGRVGLLPEHRFRFPHQLSGGQRQRVAIARALAVEPEILLLDEATSALDVSVQADILRLLAEIRRDAGLTFLFVTHEMGVVSRMCDRVLVMRHGELVETLDIATLRSGRASHPYTRALFQASVESHGGPPMARDQKRANEP